MISIHTKTNRSHRGVAIHRFCRVAILLVWLAAWIPGLHAAEKLKVLIVDGQNNHDVWPKSTIMMKRYLEETGLFEVDVARTHYIWNSEREAAWLPLAHAGKC